jgi:hypothetical protein
MVMMNGNLARFLHCRQEHDSSSIYCGIPGDVMLHHMPPSSQADHTWSNPLVTDLHQSSGVSLRPTLVVGEDGRIVKPGLPMMAPRRTRDHRQGRALTGLLLRLVRRNFRCPGKIAQKPAHKWEEIATPSVSQWM